MENFWALFNDNEIIFKITAEDVRIISVISGKVNQLALKGHLENLKTTIIPQDRIDSRRLEYG